MYRQIRVDQPDSNLQCIVWRERPTDPIRTYRLSTVTYGTSSATYLAIRSMNQLALENSEHFPIGSWHVLKNFYVDNLMTGADTLPELNKIKEEIQSLLLLGGFPLRKWYSNNEVILQRINEDDKEKLVFINNDHVIKTLGLYWNPSTDMFSFITNDINTENGTVTKRGILSQTAKLFDPLGFLNPVIVTAKLFIQRLWTMKLHWDESMPMHLEMEWITFVKGLQVLEAIRIPRRMLHLQGRVQLHGFCDASLKAFGACIYVRTQVDNTTPMIQLISAKSKVSPLRTETLPRLELCAALLLAELIDKITHGLDINPESIYLWSDSTIALSWIKSQSNQWSIFVSNRISKIQNLSGSATWQYVPSKQNPADIVSRGCYPHELLHNKMWFNGPEFLLHEASLWPRIDQLQSTEMPERRKRNHCFISTKVKALSDITQNCKFLNTFERFIRVFCYVLRVFHPKAANKEISPEEFEAALISIIRNIQSTYLENDYSNLLSKGCVSAKSRILRLNPFLDPNGLIRVGGRLASSELAYDAKHQILLPNAHLFVNALIQHYHLKNLHAGSQTVLNLIRQKFWIVDGIRTVTKVISSCIICFRSRPKLASQIMGDQNVDRSRQAPPFSISGVDFCGPVYLTQRIRGRAPIKGYTAIFVCFAVKAVHIELVPDLTTSAFLSALRRFIARRGKRNKIYSDNATNFVGARNELEDVRRHFCSSEHLDAVQQYTLSEGITWSFIPPRSPHFGGLWEAAVKSAKRHLHKVIAGESNSSFTYEEMSTLLCQIEAVLNSRPISPMSLDPTDLESLTPGHFLIGRPLNSLPDIMTTTNINRLSHYQRIQRMLQLFWKRWHEEYLNTMQSRTQWTREEPNIKVNDLVLVKEEGLPPLKWTIGRVLELHTGKDDRVRVVSVKLKNGIIKRALTKIAILPMEGSHSSSSSNST